MKTRVVITGMGAITPIGNDVESFWQGLKDKKVGIAPITYFDTTDYKCKLAAEVKGFNAKDYMDAKAAQHILFPLARVGRHMDCHVKPKLGAHNPDGKAQVAR